MLRATTVVLAPDSRLDQAAFAITLPREERYRRRVRWLTDCGHAFLLDLAETTYLPNGAGLLSEDGELILVRAAAEDLLKISAPSAIELMRIAWHIGNRHTPAEITEDAIYILPDHVLAAMVEGLGGSVENVARPFEPEGGAYGGHGSLERGHHHHGTHEHGHH
ncbi:MAG: urease accessory protein UreE [Pseudomonadota bacterium]